MGGSVVSFGFATNVQVLGSNFLGQEQVERVQRERLGSVTEGDLSNATRADELYDRK